MSTPVESVFLFLLLDLLILSPQQVRMDVGHVPHVMANLVLLRLQDVLLRQLLLPSRFVPEADVEMGIEELLISSFLRWLAGFGGNKDVDGFELAPIEVIDLHHRDAAVVADGEQVFASLLDTVFAGYAQIPPGRVFDILVVERLIEFKLPGP